MGDPVAVRDHPARAHRGPTLVGRVPGTAWIALALVHWVAIGVVTVLGATRQRRRSWWAPSARVPWWVVPVALLFNLSVLVFVNAHVLPALR